MKKTNKSTRDDYTLFQDIMDTYRYPDGTLNRIAIFISSLALILLITVGHFIITGIKNIYPMETVSASELTIDEIEKYITDSYLDAVCDYSDGAVNQDIAKEKILKMITDYIESTNGFTTQQQEALNSILEEYISSTTIYSDMEKNTADIKTISDVIDKKFTENQQYISQLQQLLQNEINANTNIDDSRFDELNKQIETLQNYATSRMAENNSNLNSMINELRRTYENSLGAKDYSEGTTYKTGDYVIYNERLYISTVDGNTSSPEDSTGWQLSDLDEIISNLEQTTFAEMQKMYTQLLLSLEEQNLYFSNELSDMNQHFTSEINDFNEHFTGEIGNVNEHFTDEINNVNENFTGEINSVNEHFTGEINGVNQSIAAQGEDFTNQINDVNQSISNQGDNFNNQISDINQTIDNQNTNLTNQINDVASSVSNQGKSLASQIQNINQSISSQGTGLTNHINSLTKTINSQNSNLQAQIDAINKLLKDNNKTFDFGYNTSTGAYGYYVNGQFKPW